MAKKLTKKSSRPQKIIKRVQQQSTRSAQHAVSPSTTTPSDRVFAVPSGEYVEGVGRRKTSSARVRIYEHVNGDFVVNQKLAGEYFSTVPNAARSFARPFELTGTKGKFAVTVSVAGSGLNSQLDAVVHGLARALAVYDPSLRPVLKHEGLLTRDSRTKETRKPGRGGKARRKRQSPKR